MIPPPKELKCQLDNKIGGLFGIAKTRAITQIIFENNEYYVGDKIRVKIICDNSKCSNKVKEFKLKLYRRFYTVKKTILEPEFYGNEESDFIQVFTAPGCPAKTKVERECII